MPPPSSRRPGSRRAARIPVRRSVRPSRCADESAKRLNYFLTHTVGGAQVKFAMLIIEDIDRTGLSAHSCTALATMVVSTVSRSRVEFTAWDTSPSARSSSTERPRSSVRSRSASNRRTFSIAMAAWSASLDQGDLLSREGLHLQAIDHDDAQQVITFEYRYTENCPNCLNVFRVPIRVFWIS